MATGPWKVLVVDDEKDVHSVTQLALHKMEFMGRPLEFYSALNTETARQLLDAHPDFAVILLDVVMETRTSGLDLVGYIRRTLGNRRLRILLRTGHPGEAPEESVIVNFDINNYLMKTELTRQKLVTNLIAALRNYNEILEIENRRIQLIEQEAANEARHAFLANMSHELGTPLNAILGFTRLLAKDHDIGEPHKEHLEIITRSARKLLNLINRVLEMSKMEAGFVQLESGPMDLLRTLQGVHSIFQTRAREQGIELVLSVDEIVPRYVVGDGQKLHQVLVNLVSNAVKFSPDARVSLRVAPAPDFIESDGIVFEVSDTGPGIDQVDQERIFEPFVQGKNQPRDVGGTGLGLAISKEFVEVMGGRLELDSVLGIGTKLRFQIALPSTGPEEVPPSSEFRRVMGVERGQEPFRILIVDDSFESRNYLWHLLLSVGLDSRTAADALQGLEVWREWQPHLILLNARLPVQSGSEVALTIRGQEDDQKLPRAAIIGLVPAGLRETIDSFMAAGCDDFLMKPVQEEILFEKIAAELGVRFIYNEESPGVAGAGEEE